MESRLIWNHKMEFTGTARGLSVQMDAKSPIGNDTALTPKELVILALAGCTGMDVVAILQKHKQPLESLEISSEYSLSQNRHPSVFTNISLTFFFQGGMEKEKVLEAVHLSQTKYCGVSAMLVKAVPIHYEIILNGTKIGTGTAYFDEKTAHPS